MFLPEKTQAAVLGTVGAWHHRAPGYRLRHLEALVRAFSPDLLCAEINRLDWEYGHVGKLPPEYRERLVPLCRELRIVVVPVGNGWREPPSPLRLALALGAGLRWVNSATADRWHRAWARLCPGSELANRQLVVRVLQALRQDPGRRVLVTVRLERRYAVADGLRQADDVALVPV